MTDENLRPRQKVGQTAQLHRKTCEGSTFVSGEGSPGSFAFVKYIR